jgi:hypothetical protein
MWHTNPMKYDAVYFPTAEDDAGQQFCLEFGRTDCIVTPMQAHPP